MRLLAGSCVDRQAPLEVLDGKGSIVSCDMNVTNTLEPARNAFLINQLFSLLSFELKSDFCPRRIPPIQQTAAFLIECTYQLDREEGSFRLVQPGAFLFCRGNEPEGEF